MVLFCSDSFLLVYRFFQQTEKEIRNIKQKWKRSTVHVECLCLQYLGQTMNALFTSSSLNGIVESLLDRISFIYYNVLNNEIK